jgi:hypothetical protein
MARIDHPSSNLYPFQDDKKSIKNNINYSASKVTICTEKIKLKAN